MSSQQQQTIVIRTVSTKLPTTLSVTPRETEMLEDLYGDGEAPRKRRRLTHLSQDEKMLRRKLKNRVAAQTARDRKKSQMGDLELKVMELERENKKLMMENSTLKVETGSLVHENESLKGQLSRLGFSSVKTETGNGSAVSTDLLQKGLPLPLSCWTKPSAASMLTLSLTLMLASLSQLHSSSATAASPLCSSAPSQEPLSSQTMKRKWWGPQQQSWNPSMN